MIPLGVSGPFGKSQSKLKVKWTSSRIWSLANLPKISKGFKKTLGQVALQVTVKQYLYLHPRNNKILQGQIQKVIKNYLKYKENSQSVTKIRSIFLRKLSPLNTEKQNSGFVLFYL